MSEPELTEEEKARADEALRAVGRPGVGEPSGPVYPSVDGSGYGYQLPADLQIAPRTSPSGWVLDPNNRQGVPLSTPFAPHAPYMGFKRELPYIGYDTAFKRMLGVLQREVKEQALGRPLNPHESMAIPMPLGDPERVLAHAFNVWATDNTFTTQDLTNDLNALGYAPEVILGMVAQWDRGATAANLLDALHSQLGPEDEKILNQSNSEEAVKEFIHTYGSQFTEQEMGQIEWIIASAFRNESEKEGDSFEAQGLSLITQMATSGIFGAGSADSASAEQIDVGLDVTRTAEARNRIASLAMEWLSNNDISDDLTRKRFFVYLWQQTQREIQNLQPEGFFGELGNFASFPYRVTSNAAADAWAHARFPAEADHKKYLTFGELLYIDTGGKVGGEAPEWVKFAARAASYTPAYKVMEQTVVRSASLLEEYTGAENIPGVGEVISAGADAKLRLDRGEDIGYMLEGEDTFHMVSGTFDAILNFTPLDPLQLIAGVGGGAKLARTVPRATNVSRARTLVQALKPFSGQGLDLPLFARGLTPRVTYSLFSRTIDEMLETPEAIRAMNTISLMDNAAEIAEKYRVPRHLAQALADSTSQAEVKELFRGASRGGFAMDAPMVANILDGRAAVSRKTYKNVLRETVDADGVQLRQLDEATLRYADNGVWIDEAVPIGDEGVTARMRKEGERIATGKGKKATTSKGRRISIHSFKDDIRVATDRKTGEWLGTVNAKSKQMAVAPGNRRQGIASSLIDALPEEKQNVIWETEEVSEAAMAFAEGTGRGAMLQTADASTAGSAKIYRAGEVEAAEGAARKRIIPSSLDDVKIINFADTKERYEFLKWLSRQDEPEAVTLTARLGDDLPLSEMEEAERGLVMRYAAEQQGDFVRMGDEIMEASENAADKMMSVSDNVVDDAAEVPSTLIEAEYDYISKQAISESAAAGNKELWIYIDAPKETTITALNRRGMKPRRNRTGRPSQWWRQTKAGFIDGELGNISMTRPEEGRRMLRKWLRAFGVDGDTIVKWEQEYYRAESVQQRRLVLFDAFQDAGRSIDNQMLKHSLLQFMSKEFGTTGFSYRTDGRHASQVGSRPRPIMLAHTSEDFRMPKWSEVKATLRRSRNAKYVPRGFGLDFRKGFGETKTLRQRNLEELKARGREKMTADQFAALTDSDWLDMAYSDVLGSGRGRIANTGLAFMNRVYGPFHTVFSLAQLAGRPIAWSSRVLVEETIRANMTQMPSLWARPALFGQTVADAHNLRRIKARNLAVSDHVQNVFNEVFAEGRSARWILADMNRIFGEDVVKRVMKKNKWTEANLADLKAWGLRQMTSDLHGPYRLLDNQIGRVGNDIRRPLAKALRKRAKSQDAATRYGFDLRGETFDQIAELISSRSAYQIYTSAVKDGIMDVARPGAATAREGARQYGRVYAGLISDIMDNADTRSVLVRMNDPKAMTGADVVKTSWWQEIKHLAQEQSIERGWGHNNDIELAEKWMDTVVAPWLEDMLAPFWTEGGKRVGQIDAARRSEILLQMSSTRQLEVNGHKLGTSGSYKNSAQISRAGGDFGEMIGKEELELPQSLAGTVRLALDEPLVGGQRGALGFVGWTKKFSDKTMDIFGERATQYLNRQPGAIYAYGKWKKKFLQLGWDEQSAHLAATEKAVHATNYIFYNNAGTSRFLNKMNRVIPFFSAWWEVLSTWTWKIPMTNVAGIGHMHLMRRVDRFFNGMEQAGIIERDGESYRLRLDPDADTGRPLADAVSRLGYLAATSPLNIVKTGVNMGRAVFGLEEYEDIGHGKDYMDIAVGSPTNFLSHGVMAVNQFGFGFTPALNAAVGSDWFGAREQSLWDDLLDVSNKLGWGATDDKLEAKAGESLLDVARRYEAEGVNVQQFLQYNQDKIEQAIGKDAANQLWAGTIELADLTLDNDAVFIVPNSAPWQDVVNDMFFPFGQFSSSAGTLGALTPSWAKYILQGTFGLMWQDDPEQEGLLGTLLGSTSEFQIGSEILNGYRFYEATEGSATEIKNLQVELYTKLGELGINIADNKRWWNDLPPDVPKELEDYLAELRQKINFLSDRYHKRAIAHAGGQLVYRGLMGFLLPATPRTGWAEQQQSALYWQSQQAVEDAMTTQGAGFAQNYQALIRDNPARSSDDINRLLVEFFEDPSGDEAKTWVRAMHPGLQPWLEGTTFWGPAGPPAELEDFDAFIDAVNDGNLRPMNGDVWMVRNMRNGIIADREIQIKMRYGSNPVDQFMGYLMDPQEYHDIMEYYGQALDAIGQFDVDINQGKYAEWRARNPDDTFVTLTEIQEQFDMDRETWDQLEAGLRRIDLQPGQIRDIMARLRAGQRELRESFDVYDNLVDNADWDNPRDRLIAQYFKEVAVPYFDSRDVLFDQLDNALTIDDRRMVFDQLRRLENEHFLTTHTVTYTPSLREVAFFTTQDILAGENIDEIAGILGVTRGEVEGMAEFDFDQLLEDVRRGILQEDSLDRASASLGLSKVVEVPSEIERSWNRLDDETKQLERLELLGSKPEWLSVGDVAQIAEQYPSAAVVLPGTPEKQAIYDELGDVENEIYDRWRAGELTQYERNQALSEARQKLLIWLRENGRAEEAAYRQALPIQRLAFVGMLPESQQPILATVNEAKELLDAQEKGWKSDYGEQLKQAIFTWLTGVYFVANPTALEDFKFLGSAMYEEDNPEAISKKLLYGDMFG